MPQPRRNVEDSGGSEVQRLASDIIFYLGAQFAGMGRIAADIQNDLVIPVDVFRDRGIGRRPAGDPGDLHVFPAAGHELGA